MGKDWKEDCLIINIMDMENIIIIMVNIWKEFLKMIFQEEIAFYIKMMELLLICSLNKFFRKNFYVFCILLYIY